MDKSFSFLQAGKGILLAGILSLGGVFLLTVFYHFTSLAENHLHILLCNGVSLGAASFYISWKEGSYGLFYGLSISLFFCFFCFVISYLFFKTGFSWSSWGGQWSACLGAAVVGGIGGALLKK